MSSRAEINDPLPVKLPAELWEYILGHLNTFQLANARLTCRNWNEIVRNSPALMGRFVIHFPEWTTLDTDSEVVKVLSRSQNRYASAVLQSARILDRDFDWWGPVGQQLTSLTLEKCQISSGALVRVLRHVPRLRRLKVMWSSEHEFQRILGIDYQLEKLELLCVDRVELLDMLRGACPKLKMLKLLDNYKPASERRDNSVIQFVREGSQDSLEGIKLEKASASLLFELSRIERLQLRRVSLESSAAGQQIAEANVVEFCQRQTAIEHLNITCLDGVSSDGLLSISRQLPRLRRLKINLCEVAHSLPPIISKLECLSIRSSRPFNHLQLDLTGHTNPHLRKLTLVGVRIPRNSLLQYLTRSGNIRSIRFEMCFFQSGSNLFSAVHQLRSLDRMHLEGINVERIMDCLSERSTDSSVQYLHLSRCVLRKEVLIALSRLLPRLEEIRLTAIRQVEASEIVLLWCQGLPRLKRLTFCDCVGFTEATAEHIGRFCPALELLHVWHCHGLSEETCARMQTLPGVQVDVKMIGEREF